MPKTPGLHIAGVGVPDVFLACAATSVTAAAYRQTSRVAWGNGVNSVDDFEFETPATMMSRLKLGREEYCQRLLTTLLLHAPYPRWNTRSPLSPVGLEFLRRLHERCFGDGWPEGTPVFVDELELPARHEQERGAAPDYAVLWDDRVWLIELKTEKASHRKEQVPYYFELGHHHHPQARIDLTYLTSPMAAAFKPDLEWGRYAHITWDQIADLIRELWPDPTIPGQREVVEGLLDAIDSLHIKAFEWRAAIGAPGSVTRDSELAPERGTLDDAMRLAEATAEDHQQRAVEMQASGLEELLELRLQIRDAIAAAPRCSPLRHVRAWIWRPESTGTPLTGDGAEVGMEVRLSWYRKPVEALPSSEESDG